MHIDAPSPISANRQMLMVKISKNSTDQKLKNARGAADGN